MSEKLNRIIEELKTLTLLEASELVLQIEKIFDVNTAISINTNTITTPIITTVPTETIEEQTSFDIILQEVPMDKKIAILKIVRSITGFGLKESKDIVDNVPKLIKEGATKEESEKFKKELEEIGAKVILK
jgi:large subunit ribosomal protein L7/L12